MKNKAALFGLYLPIFILTVLAACAFRTTALLLDFDVETGYFNDKLFIDIANVITVAASVILIGFMFNGKKNIRLIAEFSNTPTLFATALSIGAFIFVSVSLLKSFIENMKAQNAGANANILTWILPIALIFSLVSITYLIFNVLLDAYHNRLRANLAMTSTLFYASYAAYLYFNTTLPLNAPNKLVDTMAYLFFAAFFLFETRLSLGRAKWRSYIAFGFVSALLAAYSAIPSIIYYIVENRSVSDSIYESVLTLALFIFITVRTFMTGELIIDKTSPKAQLIMDASAKRNEEILENQKINESVPDEENENQISLSEIADIDKTEADFIKAAEEECEKQELIKQIEKLSTQEDG